MSDFRMKPMYKVLLCGSRQVPVGIYQLYKATPDQLCRLHYSPGSLKAIMARLKTLTREGYIKVNAVAVEHNTPNRLFYTARYFYTLAPPGVRYMAGLGFDINEDWKPHDAPDPHGLYVDHTLAINDVLIAAVQLHTADPRFYLESFTHELVLKRHPIPVRLPNGREVKIIPDAQLDFRRMGTDDHFVVLLEHDRDTEQRQTFTNKIHSYVAFVKAGGYKTAFDSTRINICFTTFHGMKHQEQMRQWSRTALASESPQIQRAFRFAALPQPLQPSAAWLEPNWHYPFDESPQPLLAA